MDAGIARGKQVVRWGFTEQQILRMAPLIIACKRLSVILASTRTILVGVGATDRRDSPNPEHVTVSRQQLSICHGFKEFGRQLVSDLRSGHIFAVDAMQHSKQRTNVRAVEQVVDRSADRAHLARQIY